MKGGSRPGAGRKADPNSKRQQALAKKAAKAQATAPDGMKPAGDVSWPFGAAPVPPAPAPEPQQVEVTTDGDPVITGDTPLEFLEAVMRSTDVKLPIRMQAAAIAAPFRHAKPAPLGKKEQREEAATAPSRFKSMQAPPRLVHPAR